MKRFFLTAFLLLALVRLSPAQPSNTYFNNGNITVVCPPSAAPQVDATNFVNQGTINVTFSQQVAPFDFSDVLNYTNQGVLSCNNGFIFNTSPYLSGSSRMAASFGNANSGNISAGSASNFFAFSFFFGAEPVLDISATNIVNRGTLDIGTYGDMNINGSGLTLRGTLHVEGFDDTNILGFFGNIGVSDNYWGVGNQTNLLTLGNLFLPDPFSPLSRVQNSTYQNTFAQVSPINASAYALTYAINASNDFFQVVYINTNLPGISTDVRFLYPVNGVSVPVIHWQAIQTNNFGRSGQTISTNDLYLADYFASMIGNSLITNNYTQSGAAQLAPTNYYFFRTFPGYNSLFTANTPYDAPGIFANAFNATNAYAAWGVTLDAVTSFPDPGLPGSTVTNVPGRIEVTAGTTLDLTAASITGPNYLNLTATNHFAGSSGATIIAPYMDINLGTTNGLLMVSNLVVPSIPRFTGTIDMYSARWTNIDATGFTNTYHVLIVNSGLFPDSLPLLLNCRLRSTNVVISDNLNIYSNLYVNAQTLTVTTNNPGAANPYGEINLFSSDIFWSSSFPVLQSLTNFGLIDTSNSVYFYATSNSPYYNPSGGLISSFVNHGIISSSGISIGANYVENSGVGTVFTNTGFTNSALIYSGIGSVFIQSGTAKLGNAAIQAPSGDISITSSNLTITNHPLQASGALIFSISNNLTDGGAASSNFWTAGNGMDLNVKPATGDFLGTTAYLTAPIGDQVFNTWAGLDRGPVESGFLNNGAMGHLILDGGNAYSQFVFGGPDATNKYAIYVDQLDLRNGAANRDNEGGVEVFTGIDAAPNFTIYFADAVIGPNDISEKLNGANGGILVWVPSYAGIFSSTNLVYPVGVTNKFNRALVQSTDIDSNGNGVANAFDSTPIYTSYNVNLTVSLTNLPPFVPVLSWSGLANSTNIVFYKTNVTSSNWTVLTNFIYGPVNGTATVVDRGRTNGTAFYKVQVIPMLP